MPLLMPLLITLFKTSSPIKTCTRPLIFFREELMYFTHHYLFTGNTGFLLCINQYFATAGSISLAHARIPPLRLYRLLNPF